MAYITQDFVSGSEQYKKSLVLQPRDFLVRETGIGGDWRTIRLGVFGVIVPKNRVHEPVSRADLEFQMPLANNINNSFMFGLTTYSASSSLEDFSIIAPGRVFLGRMSPPTNSTQGFNVHSYYGTGVLSAIQQTAIGFGENSSASSSITYLNNTSNDLFLSGGGYADAIAGYTSTSANFSGFMYVEISKFFNQSGTGVIMHVSRATDTYYKNNQSRPTSGNADALLQEYLESFPAMSDNYAWVEMPLSYYDYVSPRLNAMFIRWPFYDNVFKIYAYGWYKVS